MTQKSILITGCSSGIGYDAAKALKARGWRVFATCRRARDVKRLCSEGLESFVLDYDDPASIETALNEALRRTGGTLDALFNNGAFALPGAVEDLPRDGLRAIFETNLFGYHDLTRRVIPVMRAQGYGRIINNSSILGFIPLKWRGAYVATKYAMEGLTDVLRLEMRDTPIHIVLIEPGPVTSSIRTKAIPHFTRWIDWKASPRRDQYEAQLLKRLYEGGDKDLFELPASAVSKKLVHALESRRPRARYFVTTPTYVFAVLRRLLPGRLLDAIIARG